MTKDKFRALCEQVLIPHLGDLMHHQLADILETLDLYAREMIRIGQRLDRIERHLEKQGEHGKEA